MTRRPRTHPWIALLLALGLVACGGEAPAPGPETGGPQPTAPHDVEPSAPHPIEFVKGLAAGVEAAGDPDALLFVYLARHHPT